ncbi:MAG: hypothetical protein PHQ78_04695 [Candidatus Cloacimonetes bacterium]|nr:hypothetical protein [Candidatus Cloacimonadota bacterium]MDD4560200.1 hypothetical protein [Candidatus Cloacimonadota bacterium]
MLKNIVLALFLCGIIQLVAIDNYDTGMGLHIGNSTGSGYSFRKWYPNFGFQATLAAYSSDNDKPKFDNYTDFPKNHGKRTVKVGINYLQPLLMGEKTNFYIICGGSYSFRKERIYEDEDHSEWKSKDRWTVGIGPGFEFQISNHLRLTVELPITHDHKGDTSMLIPASGLYYYFK